MKNSFNAVLGECEKLTKRFAAKTYWKNSAEIWYKTDFVSE